MIDVKFDFTLDSPRYWDRFWESNDGLGGGGSDPDSASEGESYAINTMDEF